MKVKSTIKTNFCASIIIPILLVLVLKSCTNKNDDINLVTSKKNEEIIAEWAEELNFTPVTVSPGRWGYRDIIFHQGVGALLDSENRIYFTYDNGTNWSERIKITGKTLKTIALHPNGEKLFIGGTSGANYTFGAQYWVYNTPKNGTVSLDFEWEARLAQTDELINHDFMRSQWSTDGSVYATFGRNNKTDGFFGNLHLNSSKKFTRRTPSFSRLNDKTPTRIPSHCEGFYIKNNSEITTICTYEYLSSARMNVVVPYISYSKGGDNSWLSLGLYWKADLVHHIGQDLTGKHAIYVSQANRLFYDGKYLINHKNLFGELQCAAIDNNGYLWVGTTNGLYKSSKKMPDL